jgi:hypothetical protein
MSTVKQTRTIARELPTGGVAPPRFTPNHKLVLAQVVAALIEDGLLGTADGDRILLDARSGQGRLDLHPLVVIANLKPKDGARREQDPDAGIADRVAGGSRPELPYFKIDPMKIKMAEVTEVIGQAYAQRYRILPVAVTAEQVVFATSEPMITGWRPDLTHILRKEVQCVVANPLDVSRYLMEFYGVTRSVRKAKDQKDGRQPRTSAARSSTSSNCWSSARAPRWVRTTSTSCRSSTGCCSTPSSSAPATSTWSRAGKSRTCVSASTV